MNHLSYVFCYLTGVHFISFKFYINFIQNTIILIQTTICFNVFCCTGISLGNDPDGYGFPVKGIIESGTIKRDGSIQINDRILKIGDQVLTNITIQQARAVLRKAAMQDEVV